jgi:2-polyprenyl-6-methoxyphenol hydroxylase-like FAD-dependent oxidoreductase
MMTNQHLGRRAVVIGAGIGGLAAAGAVAPFFEDVVILERDRLPSEAEPRPGVPQGRHLHGLLGGGLKALCALLPDFASKLTAAGAVPIRMSADFRAEVGGQERRRQDLGWQGVMQSRPLLERVMQTALAPYQNVLVLGGHRVLAINTTPDGARVTGVRHAVADSGAETLAADLVIDSSGRGVPTLNLLQALDRPRPKEIEIGIDLSYASALFTLPEDAPKDWLAAVTHANLPQNGRAGVVNAIEGGLWIVTLCGRGDEQPPADPAAFIGYARSLATQTIFNAIKGGEMIGGISRFGIPGSTRRYFDLATMPDRLIVLGDALCRFNPIYGQGMSVAACEAARLRDVLIAWRDKRSSLDGLGRQFQVEAQRILDGPWQMSAVPDLAHPATRGQRPDDFEQTLAYSAALQRLALADPAVEKLVTLVWHMMKPASALHDPELVARVKAEIAAQQAA